MPKRSHVRFSPLSRVHRAHAETSPKARGLTVGDALVSVW
jgi:hypothetical protein